MNSKKQSNDFDDFHQFAHLQDEGRSKKFFKMTEQKNNNHQLLNDNFSKMDKIYGQEKHYEGSKSVEYHKNRNLGVSNKKNKPFYLKRTVYALSLLAFMMIISYYFDFLSNYNFLSLLLGCIACVVFQVKVLQFIFKKQMYKMQIDEYGALRAKIKYLFGQLNTNYLDQKNRKKYYHHNLSAEDKLFDKQNEDIYNNTMQHLVSKSKINHIENIQKIHRKWQIILTKYDIMKKFVNSFMELHSLRAEIFVNFICNFIFMIEKINSSFGDSDYKMMEKILKFNEPQREEEPKTPFENINKLFGVKKTNSLESDKQKGFLQKQSQLTDFSLSQDGVSMSENNTLVSLEFKKQLLDLKKESQSPKQSRDNRNLLTWKQVISSLEYRHRINVKKQAYMKQSVLDELRLTSDEAKVQRQSNIKQIQYLRTKYQQNIKNKMQIQTQIHKLRLKIQELSSVIVNKKRTTENNQQICKMQLDIRIKKVEIQNLQIKVTLVDDLIKRNSYQLYVKCRDINKELQTRTLPQFNNKLSNYINMILQYEKRCSKYVFNLIKESQSNVKPLNDQNNQTNLLFDPAGILQEENTQKIQELLNSQSFTQIYQIFRTSQRSEQNIKTFFEETKKYYKQMSLNFQKTVQTIEAYQKQLFEKANGQGINNNGRNINFSSTKDKQNQLESLPSLTTNYATNLFYDRYFLNILSSLSRKDEKVINQSLKIIQKQSTSINQYLETYSKPSSSIVQSIVQKFTKIDQEMKKMQKNKTKSSNPDQFSMRLSQYQSKIYATKKQLYVEIKRKDRLILNSLINQLTKQIIEKHYKIYQYILVHEKKSFHFEAPTQKQEQEQNRNIKFKQYQLYVLKIEKNNFDDPLYQSLSRNNQNRNQTKKKPLINQNHFKTPSITQKNQQNATKSEELITKDKHIESKQDSLKMLNRLLGVLFEEWSNSQFFHDLIKEELEISLNFKRPGIVEPLRIIHFKIEEKTKQSGFQDLVPQASEMYRCLFDVKINFKGKIAVHIASRLNFGNRTPLNIQLLIKQFKCPLRICFNPFSIAKSYVSLLQRPHLSIQYDVKIGEWHITRIPFFSQFIKIFIVLKLRKKMLWPKRITLSIPLAYKNTLGIAIRQRILFENEKRKQKMN